MKKLIFLILINFVVSLGYSQTKYTEQQILNRVFRDENGGSLAFDTQLSAQNVLNLVFNPATNSLNALITGAIDNLGNHIATTTLNMANFDIINVQNIGIGISNPETRLHIDGRIYQTGLGNSTFLGYQAGYSDNLQNNRNTFIGYKSGYSNINGGGNIYIGYQTGYFNVNGIGNVFIGNNAGYDSSGSNNIFIGNNSGYLTERTENTFLGNNAGRFNTTGTGNTFIGMWAGYLNTIGNYNTFLGYNAGNCSEQRIDAINSIGIGYNVCTTKNNQVVIGNTNIKETLLQGDVGIGTTNPIEKLDVNGSIRVTGKVDHRDISKTIMDNTGAEKTNEYFYRGMQLIPSRSSITISLPSAVTEITNVQITQIGANPSNLLYIHLHNVFTNSFTLYNSHNTTGINVYWLAIAKQ